MKLPGSRELLAAAVGGLVVVAAVGEALLDRSPEPRLAASNARTAISDTTQVLAPGATHCQADYFPADAAAVRVYVGTRGRPGGPFSVSLTDPRSGAGLTLGRVRGGYRDKQPVRVPLTGPHRGADPARVCVTNEGEGTLEFAHHQPLSSGQVALQAQPRIRLDFLLAGQPRNVELAPRMARRGALMKSSLIGPWTLWLVPAVLIGIAVVAVRLVLREARR